MVDASISPGIYGRRAVPASLAVHVFFQIEPGDYGEHLGAPDTLQLRELRGGLGICEYWQVCVEQRLCYVSSLRAYLAVRGNDLVRDIPDEIYENEQSGLSIYFAGAYRSSGSVVYPSIPVDSRH